MVQRTESTTAEIGTRSADQAAPASALSPRAAAKADRREALLDAAEGLFAAQGVDGARLEDLGAAAEISGPAVYRHFSGKADVLGHLLLRVSRDLLTGGQAVEEQALTGGGDAEQVLEQLVRFHTGFALDHRDVIVVHERERRHLSAEHAAEVARLQRAYIDLWAHWLRRVHPALDASGAVFRAQAAFGLINSTPHSLRRSETTQSTRREVLVQMALAALLSDTP